MDQQYKIEDYYLFDRNKPLGVGSLGKVYKGVNRYTGILTAVKEIPKKEFASRDLLNQIRSYDHPSLVKIYELFEDSHNLYITMNFNGGGNLYEYFALKAQITEHDIAEKVRYLLSCIYYLNGKGITHKNLKPENILVVSSKQNSDITVTNFGFVYPELDELFASPQLLNGEEDANCDVWSAGIILHTLLTGFHPFENKSDEEIQQFKKNGLTDLKSLKGVSQLAQDLLLKMLSSQRASVIELFQHPWFSGEASKKDILNVQTFLKNISSIRKLQKVFLNNFLDSSTLFALFIR